MMINVTELRVGNIVLYTQDNDELPVLKIDGDSKTICLDLLLGLNMDVNEQDIQPIPLTPEWLERCGFEKVTKGIGLSVLDGYVKISSLFTGMPLTLDIDGNRMPLHGIKYLHQLQNLYFALTDEELQIKNI